MSDLPIGATPSQAMVPITPASAARLEASIPMQPMSTMEGVLGAAKFLFTGKLPESTRLAVRQAVQGGLQELEETSEPLLLEDTPRPEEPLDEGWEDLEDSEPQAPLPTMSFAAKEIIETAHQLGGAWGYSTEDYNPDETTWHRVSTSAREFFSDLKREIGGSHLLQGVISSIGRFFSDWSKDAVQTFPFLGELFGSPFEEQPGALSAGQRPKVYRPNAARQDLVDKVTHRVKDWTIGHTPSTSEERDFVAIVRDLADYGMGELEKDARVAPLVQHPTYFNDVCERGLQIGDVIVKRLEEEHGGKIRHALLNRFCVASPFAFANEADAKCRSENRSSIEGEAHVLEKLQEQGMLHPAISIRATSEGRRLELKKYYTALFTRLLQTAPYLEIDSDPLVARLNRPASVKFGDRGVKMGAILMAELWVEQIERLSSAEFLMPLIDGVVETTQAFSIDPFAAPAEVSPHPKLTAEEQAGVSKLSTIVCRDILANDSLSYVPLKLDTALSEQADAVVGTFLHSVDGRARVRAEPLVDWASTVRDNTLGRESPTPPKKPKTRLGSAIGKALHLDERCEALKRQMESYPWAFTNLALQLTDDIFYTLFPEMERVGLVDRLETSSSKGLTEEEKVDRAHSMREILAHDLLALLKQAAERPPVAISLHYYLMKKQMPGCWERLKEACQDEVDGESRNEELFNHLLELQGSVSAKELVKCAVKWLHDHPSLPLPIEPGVPSGGAK